MARGHVALATLCIALIALLVPVGGGASRADVESGNYIVMLASGVDPAKHAKTKGIATDHTYRAVFRGYSAQLSEGQARALETDREVNSVQRSRVFHQPAGSGFATAGGLKSIVPQLTSVSLARVGALRSPTAKIDGIDERVDVDVAILDDGLQPDHPDLNVVGGRNCIQGKANDWTSRYGHGIQAGGIVGAIDNGFGTVGIAPGARLWAVRVADSAGNIDESELICGLEWIVAGGADIEVANMSLSGAGTNIYGCDTDPAVWDALLSAICAAVAEQITLVAAAGNEGMDASTELPAAYPDVMGVSAFAETDGLPGGLGPSSGSFGCSVDIADDTFAFFSNFGPIIDLAAPGVCVATTYRSSTYAGGTGTSFSCPIVAGAAALYLANHPSATPAKVRDTLVSQRERGPIAGDPDGIDEGIVDVSKL